MASSLAAGAYLLLKGLPDPLKKGLTDLGIRTDKTLPRGLRNNNPLNLASGVDWDGLAGSDGQFDIFKTMQDGMNAGAHNAKTQIKKGFNTVQKLLARWAPGKNGNNEAAYLKRVCALAGVKPAYTIDPENRLVFAQILRAMAVVENGDSYNGKIPPVDAWVVATRA